MHKSRRRRAEWVIVTWIWFTDNDLFAVLYRVEQLLQERDFLQSLVLEGFQSPAMIWRCERREPPACLQIILSATDQLSALVSLLLPLTMYLLVMHLSFFPILYNYIAPEWIITSFWYYAPSLLFLSPSMSTWIIAIQLCDMSVSPKAIHEPTAFFFPLCHFHQVSVQ